MTTRADWLLRILNFVWNNQKPLSPLPVPPLNLPLLRLGWRTWPRCEGRRES